MLDKNINDHYLDSKFWNWNGYKISWNLKGNESNTPILLIHGFGACSAHWRKNINYFVKKGYSVYSLDLLGFGKSDQPSYTQIGGLDNGIWCDQVSDFIKDIVRPQNSQKIILIGNSLGSLVALTCGVYIPEDIKGIIASPLPDQIQLKDKQLKINPTLRAIKKFLIKIFFFQGF